MTSSLVGSEMCIRDRVFMNGSVISFDAFEQYTGSRIATGPGAWPPVTVSYTHLTLPTICSV
eukprot:2742754-Prorocentrum_lima.AAC.1